MSKEPTFFEHYRELYRPLLNAVNSRLAKFQLYNAQWVILRIIYYKGPMTLADLAKDTRVEKPSVTRIIHKLIELEYIETKQGDDKREKYVYLTESGKDVLRKVRLEVDDYLKSLTIGIPEDELQIASKVLKNILENVIR